MVLATKYVVSCRCSLQPTGNPGNCFRSAGRAHQPSHWPQAICGPPDLILVVDDKFFSRLAPKPTLYLGNNASLTWIKAHLGMISLINEPWFQASGEQGGPGRSWCSIYLAKNPSASPPCNSTAQCRLVDKSKSELCKSKASIASQDPLAAAMFKAWSPKGFLKRNRATRPYIPVLWKSQNHQENMGKSYIITILEAFIASLPGFCPHVCLAQWSIYITDNCDCEWQPM